MSASSIKSLLAELKLELLKVILLTAFLDATILFLALYLVLSLFGGGVLAPLLLALLSLFLDVRRLWRRHSYRFIEKRNPELREMLRTAADNKEETSIMAQALFADLFQRVRRLSSGTLLDVKGFVVRLGLIFGLSLLLVTLAFFNVNVQKFENPLAGVNDRLSSYARGFLGGEELENATLQELSDIYGDPSLAKLGSKELAITVSQNLNRIDFTRVEEASPESGDLRNFPARVSVQASEAFTAGLEDVSDRKTAAEYSQEIKR